MPANFGNVVSPECIDEDTTPFTTKDAAEESCGPTPRSTAALALVANCALIALLILYTVTERAHPKHRLLVARQGIKSINAVPAAPPGTANTTAAPTPTEVNEEQEPDKMTGTSTANKVVTPIVVPKGSSLASVDKSSGIFSAKNSSGNNIFASAIPKGSAIRILPPASHRYGCKGEPAAARRGSQTPSVVQGSCDTGPGGSQAWWGGE